MKYYATFHQLLNHKYVNGKMERVSPYLSEILGSDGVFPLDGRLTRSNMVFECIDRIHALKTVQPYICGYTIYRGSRFGEGTPIHTGIIPPYKDPEGLFQDFKNI